MKLLAILVAILTVLPIAFATNVGVGIGIDITPEAFGPLIWECNSGIVLDDTLQGGRDTDAAENMTERSNNYAFEGEQIYWEVLVMDKNKIEEVTDVVATIGLVQGIGNDIEVECVKTSLPSTVPTSCNARIGEEDLTGDSTDSMTQAYYECTLTVETANSMYGEYFITIEAIGSDGQSAAIDENEYWYLNPVIGLSVTGDLVFTDVRPGTVAYSDTLLVSNDADVGSGVLLDTFISGSDFYDPVSSGARCPVTNRLKLGDNTVEDVGTDGSEADGSELDDICEINLDNDETGDHICYYASNGAYATQDDPREDTEGYVPIVYGDTFTSAFYNDAEIIGPTNNAAGGLITIGGVNYFAGNVLTPGADIAITFKLGLPEPCVGDFSDGSLYFWGEAI